jgi:hypothetical protein
LPDNVISGSKPGKTGARAARQAIAAAGVAVPL